MVADRLPRAALWAPLVSVALGWPTGAGAQAPAAQRPADSTHGYEVLTKGLLGGPPLALQFRTARVRLVIRNLIMGPGSADSVPIPMRVVMELRGGALTARINGKTVEHFPGDFWVLEKGSAVSLQNRGDVVVIRAIYVLEGGP